MFSITHVAFTNLLPTFSKKFKDKAKFLTLVDLICGVSFILLGFTTNFILGIIFLLIIIALGNPRPLLFINGINRHVDTENRATVLSTINVISSSLKAVFYPLIGFLILVNINFLYLIFGVLILILALKTKLKEDYL